MRIQGLVNFGKNKPLFFNDLKLEKAVIESRDLRPSVPLALG
jgi:hypothetical protein